MIKHLVGRLMIAVAVGFCAAPSANADGVLTLTSPALQDNGTLA